MDLGSAPLLVLLAATPLALAIGVWTMRWRARQAGRMIRAGGGAVVTRSDARSRLWWLTVLALAVALLAFAAARPQIGDRETEVRQTGVAVAVALDVSLSMGAQDADPNRLSVAQAEIGRLLQRLQGDRVGLVIFGGEAFVRFPLTRDLRSAQEIIDAVQPGEGFVAAGTDISAAIDAARTLLEDSDAATRAILIVSDGESLRGDALLAAGEAAGLGIHVFAGGIGTPDGATILVDNGLGRPTPQVDENTGEPIISRADFGALLTLADAGRGRFVSLTQPGALSTLADDFDALAATTFAVRRESIPIERFQIFAAIALVLLLLEPAAPWLRRAWRWGRDRRTQPAALALIVLVTGVVAAACASSAFSHNERGNEHYEAGEYRAALSEYRQAQADEPGDRRLNLNAGRALHGLGELDRAISETSRATDAEDPQLAARAFFNLGNHLVAAGDLVAARNAYIEALLRDPADFDAKFNLELVNATLAVQLPPGTMPGDGPPNPGQQQGDNPDPGEEGSQLGQEADDGVPLDPAEQPEGDESAPGEEGVGQQSTGDGAPGGVAGEQEEGEGSAAAAAAALEEALAELDRDAPTRAQALAILDALRARTPREALTVGPNAPVSIDPEER